MRHICRPGQQWDFCPFAGAGEDSARANRCQPRVAEIIAAPRKPDWDVLWKTGEEWRAAANAQAAKSVQSLPAMRERLHVTVQPVTMDGVKVYVVTPDVIPPEHRDKLLIHVHGGCYVLSPGESGTAEAIIMAGLGHFKVISVDYRMPPEAYFPGGAR